MGEYRRTATPERGWAWDRIGDWLGTSERMLLISGAPGSGKTRLMAELVRQGRAPGLTIQAAHHCRTRDPSSTDPIRVFASLAAQLARRVPGYGAVARDLGHGDHGDDAAAVHSAVLDSVSPEAAYQRALQNPFEVLASIGRLQQDVVLIVDGLDECTPSRSDLLRRLLAGSPGVAVPYLRVIATTRTRTATDGRGIGGRSFDLTSDSPDIGRDVADFLARSPDLSPCDASALAAASDGCLLYADLAARLVRVGGRRAAEMPSGIDGLYAGILDSLNPFARRVVDLLARSRGDGLTPRQLTNLLEASGPGVNDVLDGCRAVISGRRRTRLHHRYFGEYIAATAGGQASVELDWLIAERLLRDGANNWHTSDGYGLRHVLVHLADVGAAAAQADRRAAAGRAIGATINEPEFLSAALSNVGVDDLLSGLEYVLDRAPTVSPDVGRVAELLRAQAPTLRKARTERDDRFAVQQLIYEAATIGATGIARALVGRMPSTSILTLWATVNSPTRFAPDARPGHRIQVDDATVMLDGERGVTTSRDGIVRVWQLASGQLSHEVDTANGANRLTALADPTDALAAWPDGVSDAVKMDSGERIPLEPEQTALMSAFAVDRDGVRGISGDADGNATIWDLQVGEPINRLTCRAGLLTAVDITVDGWTAATGSITGDIVLWDVATGLPVHRLTCPGVVCALAFTPCGRRLLVGDHSSLWVYVVPAVSQPSPVARLVTRSRVTALAVNPALPSYVLCGTASGQVAYVRIP